MGGMSTNLWPGMWLFLVLSTHCFGGVGKMWGSDRVRVYGTLLGPETTGPILLVLAFCWCWWGWFWFVLAPAHGLNHGTLFCGGGCDGVVV